MTDIYGTAADKQLKGQKGANTRRRIMDATLELISQGKSEVRITDITRAANLSQPHFYVYFSTVKDVFYAIAEDQILAKTSISLPDVDIPAEQQFSLLREMIESGIRNWQENSAINTMCDFLADQGPGKFRDLRARHYEIICNRIAEKISAIQARGKLSADIQVSFRAHQCLRILTDIAKQYDLLIATGFSHQEIVDGTAHLLFSVIGYGL